MSRTDKDAPWWVAAEWWEPDHWRCDRAHEYPGNPWGQIRVERRCDLPAEPDVRHYDRTSQVGRCQWLPKDRRSHSEAQGGPPRWYREHVWTNPTRRKVRDDCRQAVKEYRASGEVDVIPPIDQHRQCAGWWWW